MEVTNSGSTAPLIYLVAATTPTGDFRLIAENIDQGNGSSLCIQSDNTEAEAAAWIIAHTITGRVTQSGSKLYITCQKLTGSIIAGVGKFYCTLQKIGGDFVSSTAPLSMTGGQSWIDINQFEPGTNWAQLVNVSGGTHFLESQEMDAAASQDAVTVSAGTLNLLSGKIATDAPRDDLVHTGGTLNVSPNVVYDSAKTSGTITKLGPKFGTYTVTGGSADRALDAGSATLADTTNVLATLIADLKLAAIIQ